LTPNRTSGTRPSGSSGMMPHRLIPLSQFFANRDNGVNDDGEEDQVMGYQEPPAKKAPGVPKKKDRFAKAAAFGRKHAEKQEGMTTSANIGTTAVPIGPGIDDVNDILDFAPGHPKHKKRKQKKGMSRKLGGLLRRRNPVT
jgi:hypothetical protein